MRVTIYPSIARGTVNAPSSKSVAHRALICGALSEGAIIHNCGTSQDVEATLRCLQALGADVVKMDDGVKIGGLDPFYLPVSPVLDCGESGSTLRFLLPLCLLSGQKVTLTGRGRLLSRPLDVYKCLFTGNDFLFEQCEDAITVCGNLQSGDYVIPGNVSSQFITGLIFALSQLSGESRIEVTGGLESAPYVDITLSVLEAFGLTVRQERNVYTIPSNAIFRSLNYIVEGDYSNAASLEALNALGGSVKVMGLSAETAQGDRVYRQMFTELGEGKRLFDLTDCPDLGPIMFALAAARGGAEFIGTARLRYKESDRCTSMAEELAKFGIDTIIGENSFEVLSGSLRTPTEPLRSHNDHRIVMALSLLCTVTGGMIDDAEAVAKSFPDYFDAMQSLGIQLDICQ